MTFDTHELPKPYALPPHRFALRRSHLLEELMQREQKRGRHRRLAVFKPASRPRLAIVVALLALLGIAGTAVGVGINFLAEQERVDRRLWSPPELSAVGARVEIERGDNWSFMAWQNAGGVCVAYAA
jgi:hypothetical protein